MDEVSCCELRIAGISIRMELDDAARMEQAFVPFLSREDLPQIRAEFRRVAELPPIPEAVLHEDLCYRVHPDGKGAFMRSFFDAPRDRTPYALARYDYSGGVIRVDYLEKGRRCLSEMSTCFFHMGIESIMLHRKHVFLHAACVQTHLGGILFSGPSGVGKSTQARLWNRHRGSRIINGDRTILSREGEDYFGWGSPYAGSSGIHVSESAPIRGIFLLRQGKQCALRRLGAGEAFRRLYGELTLPAWDRTGIERACDFLLELAQQVPVFEFSCTADVSAVDYLENALRGVADL